MKKYGKILQQTKVVKNAYLQRFLTKKGFFLKMRIENDDETGYITDNTGNRNVLSQGVFL